jgi:hypothetical protein
LQPDACLDDDRPSAGRGRQREQRGIFLPLWQEEQLLRRQTFRAGVVARFNDSGVLFPKSVFPDCSRDNGLGIAQHARARDFFLHFSVLHDRGPRALRAELRLVDLIFSLARPGCVPGARAVQVFPFFQRSM